MNNYLPLLQTTTLFAGLSAAELSMLLSPAGGQCAHATARAKPLCWPGSPAAG